MSDTNALRGAAALASSLGGLAMKYSEVVGAQRYRMEKADVEKNLSLSYGEFQRDLVNRKVDPVDYGSEFDKWKQNIANQIGDQKGALFGNGGTEDKVLGETIQFANAYLGEFEKTAGEQLKMSAVQEQAKRLTQKGIETTYDTYMGLLSAEQDITPENFQVKARELGSKALAPQVSSVGPDGQAVVPILGKQDVEAMDFDTKFLEIAAGKMIERDMKVVNELLKDTGENGGWRAVQRMMNAGEFKWLTMDTGSSDTLKGIKSIATIEKSQAEGKKMVMAAVTAAKNNEIEASTLAVQRIENELVSGAYFQAKEAGQALNPAKLLEPYLKSDVKEIAKIAGDTLRTLQLHSSDPASAASKTAFDKNLGDNWVANYLLKGGRFTSEEQLKSDMVADFGKKKLTAGALMNVMGDISKIKEMSAFSDDIAIGAMAETYGGKEKIPAFAMQGMIQAIGGNVDAYKTDNGAWNPGAVKALAKNVKEWANQDFLTKYGTGQELKADFGTVEKYMAKTRTVTTEGANGMAGTGALFEAKDGRIVPGKALSAIQTKLQTDMKDYLSGGYQVEFWQTQDQDYGATLIEGDKYVVKITEVKEEKGKTVPKTAFFKELKDGEPTGVWTALDSTRLSAGTFNNFLKIPAKGGPK